MRNLQEGDVIRFDVRTIDDEYDLGIVGIEAENLFEAVSTKEKTFKIPLYADP